MSIAAATMTARDAPEGCAYTHATSAAAAIASQRREPVPTNVVTAIRDSSNGGMIQTPSRAPVLADAAYGGVVRSRSAATQPSARWRNMPAATMYVSPTPIAPQRAAARRDGRPVCDTVAMARLAYAGSGGTDMSDATCTNSGRNLPAASCPPRAVSTSTAALNGCSAAVGGCPARYEYSPNAIIPRTAEAARS